MDDLEARLVRCFGLIFPALDEKQIRRATNADVPSWDSMAMVILVNVVEEEFGMQIDMEDAEHLTSFGGFLAYMRTRGTHRDR